MVLQTLTHCEWSPLERYWRVLREKRLTCRRGFYSCFSRLHVALGAEAIVFSKHPASISFGRMLMPLERFRDCSMGTKHANRDHIKGQTVQLRPSNNCPVMNPLFGSEFVLLAYNKSNSIAQASIQYKFKESKRGSKHKTLK